MSASISYSTKVVSNFVTGTNFATGHVLPTSTTNDNAQKYFAKIFAQLGVSETVKPANPIPLAFKIRPQLKSWVKRSVCALGEN